MLQDAVGKVSVPAKIGKLLVVLETSMSVDGSWGRTGRAVVLGACSQV